MIKIINIVDSIERVNFGVWNAAIATAPYLLESYQIESYLWHPKSAQKIETPSVIKVVIKNSELSNLQTILNQYQHTPKNTIVVSHGCWQIPTKIAASLEQLGYKWIYIPHGMLEPWSMQKKWFKKWIYFNLIERRLSKRARWVRAVGAPESENLKRIYSNVWLNQNGIDDFKGNISAKWENKEVTNYLFMARLHSKKGIIPLVKAWIASPQAFNTNNYFYIAGPDDGEMSELDAILSEHQNINIGYLGAVYGEDKRALLERSHIYLLPSFSEGFPTSVLEAMGAGALAVITEGCNFPEAFAYNMATKTTTEVSDISQTLKELFNRTDDDLSAQALQGAQWVLKHYSNRKIAQEQASLYSKLLN